MPEILKTEYAVGEDDDNLDWFEYYADASVAARELSLKMSGKDVYVTKHVHYYTDQTVLETFNSGGQKVDEG
jgi:hypothetical protein